MKGSDDKGEDNTKNLQFDNKDKKKNNKKKDIKKGINKYIDFK